MNQPKIQIKDLYLISAILILVVVVANIWNLISNWTSMNLPAKISFIAGSIFFEVVLFTMFYLLWKVTPKFENIVDDKDLDNILKNIEKGGREKNVRKIKKEKTF
jgi:hypothetical protein